MSCPHMVQVVTSFSLEAEFWEEGSEGPTVGSCATSAVTPAVAPTVDAISCLITHDEGASSVKEHVLQANSSLFSALSSRGNSKFELRCISACIRDKVCEDSYHSEQKRKRICLLGSCVSLLPYSAAAGDDMAVWFAVYSVCVCVCVARVEYGMLWCRADVCEWASKGRGGCCSVAR
jgi:hypothetical protein